MGNIVFVNNASSLLAASINNLDTVIQVSSGDGALFPVFTAPEFFVATLEDDAGNIEVVQCTGRTGDLLTVVRGFDNSVAQSFDMSTTRVELRLTAVVVEEFIQRSGDIMTGDLDMNQNDLIDAKLTGPNTQILAGEIVGVPLRGDSAVSSNEVITPSGGGRATAGGAEIRVVGDDLTPDIASATESSEGIAEIADQTEMDAGTDDDRFVTPKKFADTKAEEEDGTDPGHFGVTRFATTAEVEEDVPTADDAAISPARLDEKLSTEDRFGVIKLADQAEVDAGTVDDKAVTPLTLTAFPGIGSGNNPIFTGYVPSNGIGEVVPSGWSALRNSIGVYTVTHGLGLSDVNDLIIMVTALGEPAVPPPASSNFIYGTVFNRATNSFQVLLGFPDMGTIGGAEHEDHNWMFMAMDNS